VHRARSHQEEPPMAKLTLADIARKMAEIDFVML
jgi:hypothetical protein